MSLNSPEEIIETVNRMESDRSELHRLMDGDMDDYNQVAYQGELDADGVDRLSGYAHFTSSNPTTYMDLALHMGSTASRIISVKEARETEEAQETNNMSELFGLGALKSADDLRANLFMPDVQSAGFAMSLYRGRVCYRALLRKEDIEGDDFTDREMQNGGLFGPDGGVLLRPQNQTRTIAEIVDWDPRNVYFGLGRDGLDWACYKAWKSRRDIIAEYGIDPSENDESNPQADYDTVYEIYDYFDRESNTILVKNFQVLKEPEPHWMTRVPVSFAFADNRPFFYNQRREGSKDNTRSISPEYGRGFYHANRRIFREQNFMYSVMKELAHRAIKPGLKVFSDDGSLTLDEGDPHETGQKIPLSKRNNEDVETLTAYELTPTAIQFMGTIGGMEQRAAFHTGAFGDIGSNPPSGFALSQLRENLLYPLTVHVNAVQSALKQCLDILRSAYGTGKFNTMTMSGYMQDPNKTFFSKPIPPAMVKGGGMYEVKLLPKLPHDDAGRLALITGMKQSGLPVDDRTLLEMLEFQDPSQLIRAWWEQQANRGSPEAMAYNAEKASAEQGNEEVSAIWGMERNIARMTKFLEMLQLLMMGGGGGLQNGSGNGNGSAPERRPRLPSATQLPPEMMGLGHTPNPAAASAGAQSNAGQPRNRPPVNAAGLRDLGLWN